MLSLACPNLPYWRKTTKLLHLQSCKTPMVHKVYDTIVKQDWILWTGNLTEWSPHLFCLVTKLHTISMNMWTLRTAGIGLQKTPCYAMCHNMTLCLVRGVLWVQLELLGPFFFTGDHVLTPICYTHPDTSFCKLISSSQENLYLFPAAHNAKNLMCF